MNRRSLAGRLSRIESRSRSCDPSFPSKLALALLAACSTDVLADRLTLVRMLPGLAPSAAKEWVVFKGAVQAEILAGNFAPPEPVHVGFGFAETLELYCREAMGVRDRDDAAPP